MFEKKREKEERDGRKGKENEREGINYHCMRIEKKRKGKENNFVFILTQESFRCT
jgi:hypothetical protein